MAEANWANQTIWTGDNLPIMRGMNAESVDLIYLDPPFNSKHDYAAPIGSEAAGAVFKDTWTLDDVDVAWLDLIEAKHSNLAKVIDAAMTRSDKAYLIYMAVRLLEMRRLLKPTGSIYLHCDPTMSHYLKLVMDAIFGRKRFRNEIVWCYSGPSRAVKRFAKKHDAILFYSKDHDSAPFYVDAVRLRHKRQTLSAGATGMAGGSRDISEIRDAEAKQIKAGKVCPDWWDDIGSGSHMPRKERTGYRTQKPLALLQRIIKASSDYDAIVLDPFCGCATTCVAAEILRRQWVGIDISEKAAELVRTRLEKKIGQTIYKGAHRRDIPLRTDMGKILPYRSNKKDLYGQQGGYCNGCKMHFESRHFEVDHIIPVSQGGTDHIENLQLLCGSCNRIKGDRGMEYLKARLA